MQSFEIISEITDIEILAVGSTIRDIARLRKQYGFGRWRKLKGVASAIPNMTRDTRLRKLTTKTQRTQRAAGSEKAMAGSESFGNSMMIGTDMNISLAEFPASLTLRPFVFFVSLW